jgi:hypothetical protein
MYDAGRMVVPIGTLCQFRPDGDPKHAVVSNPGALTAFPLARVVHAWMGGPQRLVYTTAGKFWPSPGLSAS